MQFNQPDSIVPNPFNPADFNRYAYVRYNPVRYQDPTGHLGCDEMPWECDDGNFVPGDGDVTITLEDIGLAGLSDPGDPIPGGYGGTYSYGGSNVYALFQEYQDTCGWWNNNCTSAFGLQEFLGLWILMEANGNPEIAKQIAIAVAQNLFVGSGDIPPYCSAGGRCLSGVFNFIAAFAGRSGALFSGPNSAGVKIYARNRDNLTEEEARMLISQLGATGLNPDTVVDWDPMRGPTKWGNLNNSAAQKILNYMNDTVVSQGAYMNSVFYYNPENFFVMSFDQWNYWKALGVDMTILGSE